MLSGPEAMSQARWLLEELTQTDRGKRLMGYVYSESELNVLAGWARRCAAGEPIQHVTGFCEFMGLRIACDGRALVPRPETEELVSWCLAQFERPGINLRVCDAGTGTGCIALALKQALPRAEVLAIDASEAALAVAQENADRLGLQLGLKQLNFASLLNGSDSPFDLVVSNPPYIPQSEAAEMEAVVLDYDPSSALFVPDEDPLIHYRTLVEQSVQGALKPGGWLAFEVHEAWSEGVAGLLTEWANVAIHLDLQGRPRMVTAQRPEA